MLDMLVQQFINSDSARETISQLTHQTSLNEQEAQNAVHATADTAAQELAARATGQGGQADEGAAAFGGMLGGGALGGLGGALGGLLAGGAAGESRGQGLGALLLTPDLISRVTTVVASRTGLDEGIARTVVSLVLPKVVDYAQSFLGGGGNDPNAGGSGGSSGGGGGILGGLLG